MIEAPEFWTPATIGEVTLPVGKHRPEDEPSREFRYVDISSIDNGSNTVVEPKLVLGRDAPSRARQVVRVGDTVLSTVRTYLKNTAIVPADLDGATASTGFSVLRPDPDRVDPRFLFYRVLEEGFVESLSEMQTGTSYPAVRDRDVRAMAFSYPPLDEQRGIVENIDEQFSRLDAGVQSLRRAKQNLIWMRASLLGRAVRGDIAGSSLRRSSWPMVPLANVLERLRYGTSTKCSKDGNGKPVLRIPNVRDGQIVLRDLKSAVDPDVDLSRVTAEEGDVLFIRTNGSRDLIGRVGVVTKEAHGMAFASYLIGGRPSPELDSRFLGIVLSSPTWRRRIEGLAATSAGQYNISASSLKTIQIPLPQIPEQQAIVAEVDRQSSILGVVAGAIAAAEARAHRLRRSVLREAFAGRLVGAKTSSDLANA